MSLASWERHDWRGGDSLDSARREREKREAEKKAQQVRRRWQAEQRTNKALRQDLALYTVTSSHGYEKLRAYPGQGFGKRQVFAYLPLGTRLSDAMKVKLCAESLRRKRALTEQEAGAFVLAHCLKGG